MNEDLREAMTPTTYISSFVAFIASVNLNEWLAVVSICVALGTFGITWYYKHQQTKIMRGDP